MRQYFNLLFTLKVILKSNTEIDWDYHNPKHEFEFLHNLINDRFDETMIYEICKDMSHDIIKALIVNDYIDSDNIDQITIDEIQNIFMGLNILEICKQTPDIKHWIPSKEYKIWRQVLKIQKLPDNVVLRMSSPNVDQAPLTGFENTSTVHKNKKAFGLECIAYKQDGKCLECKACYNSKIKNISYPKH